ncbi:MAG: integral rane sensor signal transduction histidine kinase [Frankiales bacterium]|nr:integral rane sensor signal transduction histidine kinase [Frankiales bacterium]
MARARHTERVERRGHAWGWWTAAAGCAVASFIAVSKLLADGSSASSLTSGLVGFSCALAIGYSTIAAALRTGDPGQRFAVVLLLVAVSRAAFVVSWAWGVAGSPVAAWLAFWLPFVAVALAPLSLLWFPNGSLPDDRGRWRVSQRLVVVALVGVALIAASSWHLRGPQLVSSKDVAGGPGLAVGFLLCLGGTGVGLVCGVASLVARWRRQGSSPVRQQLKWYGMGALAAVVLNLAGDLSGYGVLNLVGTLAFLGCVLVAVTRHNLWDIDEILKRTVVYGALSGLLAAVYVASVVTAGLLLEGSAHHESLSVAVATLTAATCASPARRALQQRVDRSFDRRTFDAVSRVRAHDSATALSAPEPGATEELLREVLNDHDLTVLYACRDGLVVDAWGNPEGGKPPPPRGWALQTSASGPRLRAVEKAAGPVLARCRLQAELLVQVGEAERSRQRVVTAGDLERRRIERNLHDGAQQRLVSLALRLRSAQRHRALDPATASLLDDTVEELRGSVEDLRALAAGLLPGSLVTEGLGAALTEMAGRHPTPVRLSLALDHRHNDVVDEVAWFVALEGVTNAVKHAHASHIAVSASCDGTALVLTVADDGTGRAAEGPGLTGLRDRVLSRDGRLELISTIGSGTTLSVELPCG